MLTNYFMVHLLLICFKYIKQLLCQESIKTVTVHSLISTVHNQNNQFPISKESLSAEKEKLPEEKRMQYTEMAMNLIEKFSDVKMRDHLVEIYTWYQEVNKKDKKAMRDRAEQWATLIKERRVLLTKNRKDLLQVKHEEPERVDQARCSIYYFYEQLSSMWHFGKTTRENLKGIDFPGKGRTRDFLDFVAPLDQASYYLVLEMLDLQFVERKELEVQTVTK